MTDPLRIGLLGRGTVGSAFETLIAERAEAFAAATGRSPEIVGVLLESSEVIVELIGGTDPARDYVLRALRAGRHVVTANKQLVAQHGDELFEAASAAGVQLRFEAAVAGVIPVVRVIQESLVATENTKVFGIVNGTTNYVLTEMARTGATLDDALARAKELGYAEADPTDDVNGADAGAKPVTFGRGQRVGKGRYIAVQHTLPGRQDRREDEQLVRTAEMLRQAHAVDISGRPHALRIEREFKPADQPRYVEHFVKRHDAIGEVGADRGRARGGGPRGA